jgi:hypothetical protein
MSIRRQKAGWRTGYLSWIKPTPDTRAFLPLLLAAGAGQAQDKTVNWTKGATYMATSSSQSNIKQGIITTFYVYGVLCAVVWVCVYVGFKIASAA